MTADMIPGKHMPECNEFCEGDNHFLGNDLDIARERGRRLQADQPQREISVEVSIADRGQLTRKRWKADLDDPGQMEGIEREVLAQIRTSTGG